jgi:hypothetical protein
VEVVLWDGAGQPLNRFSQPVDVEADSAELLGSFCWQLPPGDAWRLTCQVTRQGRPLAANEYDLAAYDDQRPALGQRLWAWFSGLFVPA